MLNDAPFLPPRSTLYGHDGTTHVTFRQLKPNRNLDNLCDKLYNSRNMTEADKYIRSYTTSIVKTVNAIYIERCTIFAPSFNKNRGIDIDLRQIPLVDEKTSELLCKGNTRAVFQMESSGMTNLIKELRPEGFTDLIPLVALYIERCTIFAPSFN